MYSNISVAVFVYAKCSCSSLTPDLTAFLSSGCRLLRTLWSEWCVRPRALSVPPCYVGSSTGFHAVRHRISYKLAVITYKTNSTKTPAYLSDIIHEYHPIRTLRSADKLLLVVPRMSLTLSAKVVCVRPSAPSVWNSLSYNYRSAELLSTFKRLLKTELFDIAYSVSKSMSSSSVFTYPSLHWTSVKLLILYVTIHSWKR